uniref:Methyl-CpG binding domain protein 2 n=1 Tax=Cyprinus carpio TaxID=7962 RepID=A0A8C2BYV4_CYPCA
MIMERKRTDCPALPPGWKKEEVIRKSGLSAGKSDVYYYSPTGKKFRSKPQLSRYLGNSVDLGCFDFRTGKMMPGKMQKNKHRLRSDQLSLSKGKPDLNTALPIRQTASIFKQPVTKVVNHPNNKVKTDPQRATEQPRQLFWERRLKGLRSSDVSEEALRTMDLPKGLQSKAGWVWFECVRDRWLTCVLWRRYGAGLDGRDASVGHRQRAAHELGAHHGSDVLGGREEPEHMAEHIAAALQGLHCHRRRHTGAGAEGPSGPAQSGRCSDGRQFGASLRIHPRDGGQSGVKRNRNPAQLHLNADAL